MSGLRRKRGKKSKLTEAQAAIEASAMPHGAIQRGPLSRSDSYTVALGLLGLLVVIFVPPLLFKVLGLLAMCGATFWFIRNSFWTHEWGRKKQWLLSLLVVASICAMSVPQFISQWASEHPKDLTRPQAVVPEPPKPYDLIGERHDRFVKLVTAPREADTLRVGCLTWSERSCVAAGSFLLALSEAGWKIDGNQVFRLDTYIPKEGASIVSEHESYPGPPLPPHLGRWHKMNLTDITLVNALLEIGIPYNASSDDSLGAGTTGVYFGPEPSKLLNLDPQKINSLHIAKFAAEGRDIQHRSASSEEKEWEENVASWLRDNTQYSDVVQFRAASNIEAKWKFLLTVVARLTPERVLPDGPDTKQP